MRVFRRTSVCRCNEILILAYLLLEAFADLQEEHE